jgi:hypothetical protein
VVQRSQRDANRRFAGEQVDCAGQAEGEEWAGDQTFRQGRLKAGMIQIAVSP